jgi:glyoxylase-like metal-dependent hydrolase (beta-lactamase superfamily II)
MFKLALGLAVGICSASCASSAPPSTSVPTSAGLTRPPVDEPPPGIGKRDDTAVLGPFGSGPITLLAHQSAEYSAKVNSWLIEGPTEIGLVDAQLVLPEAQKVVELIKSRGKKLAWVFVTHSHPDHYVGLEAIAAAFPDTPRYARPETTVEAPALFRAYEKPLQRFYSGQLPTTPTTLTPYTEGKLRVDGVDVHIIDLKGGEHTTSTMLHLPSMRALLVADLVYNRVHPWTNELDTDGILHHLDALEARTDIDTFYPGHGEPFDKSTIAAYRSYLLDFLADAAIAKDSKELILTTWRRHRDWRTLAGLRFSAEAHIGARDAKAKTAPVAP